MTTTKLPRYCRPKVGDRFVRDGRAIRVSRVGSKTVTFGNDITVTISLSKFVRLAENAMKRPGTKFIPRGGRT